jgi:hypothetical protein
MQGLGMIPLVILLLWGLVFALTKGVSTKLQFILSTYVICESKKTKMIILKDYIHGWNYLVILEKEPHICIHVQGFNNIINKQTCRPKFPSRNQTHKCNQNELLTLHVVIVTGSRSGESPSLVLDNWWNRSELMFCSKWYEIGCTKVEVGGSQGWWRWPHVMMIRCSTLEKKKEKNKIIWAQGKGINRNFVLPVKM